MNRPDQTSRATPSSPIPLGRERRRLDRAAAGVLTILSTLGGLFACESAPKPASLPAAVNTGRTAATTPSIDRNLSVATFDAVWQEIRDTHFDPDLNGVDWIAVRETYRPQAEAATSPQELRAAIGGMLGELGQSHFELIPSEVYGEGSPHDEVDTAAAMDSPQVGAEGSRPDPAPDSPRNSEHSHHEGGRSGSAAPGWTGLVARFVASEPMVTRVELDSPAQRAGVMPGDVIVSVDGFDPSRFLQVAARDPESAMLRFEMNAMLGSSLAAHEGESISIELRSPSGSTRTIEVVGEPRPGELVQLGNLPPLEARLTHHTLDHADLSALGLTSFDGDTISNIAFSVWMPAVATAFDESIDGSREALGVVIDLRGNPGGVGGMAMGMGGHFADSPISLGTMKTREAEIRFRVNPRRVDRAGKPVQPLEIPVAILVDEMSASTSEIFAGGMQEAGLARVFGRRTPGAALPAVMLKLPNGDVLLHAVADFTTPAGVRLEGRGVIPDQAVELDAATLSAGGDPDLRAAAGWILEQWLAPGADSADGDNPAAAGSVSSDSSAGR